jgi:hypothetical protein
MLTARLVRMEIENNEMNDIEIELREALEESLLRGVGLEQEATYLNGCISGSRQEISQTSKRNLELLKL